jgi:hypothetical protein
MGYMLGGIGQKRHNGQNGQCLSAEANIRMVGLDM